MVVFEYHKKEIIINVYSLCKRLQSCHGEKNQGQIVNNMSII